MRLFWPLTRSQDAPRPSHSAEDLEINNSSGVLNDEIPLPSTPHAPDGLGIVPAGTLTAEKVMALGSKKYEGLLDLDDSPEVYETPDLTDDASTVQTDTLHTGSPRSSDEGKYDPEAGLDHEHIDGERARRRFERSVVDARDVNFSDSLVSSRKSYRTASRRRRRSRLGGGAEEIGDLSDSEDESLSRKLARLRREAEEVKQELKRRAEEGTKDDVTEDDEVADGVVKLSDMLDDLHTFARTGAHAHVTAEANFSKRLASDQAKQLTTRRQKEGEEADQAIPLPTSFQPDTTAIAAISDRLTALESALGLPSLDPTTNSSSTPILPTLTFLLSQITTLATTLAPPSPATTTSNSGNPSSTAHIETLRQRIQTLTHETDKLTTSRKAATEAAISLSEARLRIPDSHTTPYGGKSGRPSTPPDQHHHHHANEPDAQLLLDEQTSKINALYATLPTIQSLHPLLPSVLDRLRSLSGIHAGAGRARADLDEVDRRQKEVWSEIERWRVGLEGVEKVVQEAEDVMRGNVEVIGAMVRGVEEKLVKLER